MTQTSKSSVPAREGASSTAPSTSVSDHEMGTPVFKKFPLFLYLISYLARLLEVLSNITLSPAAANALITVIGIVATPGDPIDDEDAPTVVSSPPREDQELPPTPEDLFRDAPENAMPGQPLQYHVPRPGSQGPFFAVTRGLAVGIFSGWYVVLLTSILLMY